MRSIIRSVSWQQTGEKSSASENIALVMAERFLEISIAEGEILEFCTEFYVKNAEAVAFRLLYDHFESLNKPEVVSLLEESGVANWYESATFKSHYESLVESRSAEHLTTVCKEAVKIAVQGIKVKGQTVKGVDAGISFLFSSAKATPRDDVNRTPNSFKDALPALKQLYITRKNNPQDTYGVMSGYGVFDSSTGGIRKKQLYLHAGYGGHLKTTSMLNMIVNAAVDGGWNPLLFSSEMPQEDIMFLMAAIHSANPKFNGYHAPIESFRLLLANLSPEEEAFMNEVLDDLNTNPDHGLIRIIDSGEFTTFGSVMQRTIREHSDEEVDIVWVDYITRLPVDSKYRTMTLTEGRNETIADAKRFAMSFDQGAGLAVCSPFQVNREGFKRAQASEGRMDATCLGQYNAAEKEADVITYIFFGEEERATSEPKVGVIKSRWGDASTTPVSLFIEPDSRRMFDLSAGMSSSIPVADVDEVVI